MIELPLVFLGGFLGSSHCVGMCGGFAVMIGADRSSARENLWMQLAFSCGRLSTYILLGGMAGWLGMTLTGASPVMRNVPAALCLLAGLFLIVEGLSAAGFRLWRGQSHGGCPFSSQFASLLKGGRLENAFAAGILTGFLPCGLVYAFLAMAGSTGSIRWGAAVMAAFGLGTVPLMILTGIGASLLSFVARRRMLRWAAWCVVVTGVLTVARGAAFVRASYCDSAPTCPLCVEHHHPDE